MKRVCGECTACCKTHGVVEMKKIPGKWCQHCMIGKGCGIYSNRPQECKSFECAWLIGIDGSGPQHRPDRINVVPEYREVPGIGTVMWFWELQEKSLDSDLIRSWSRRNLLAGNCVMHISLDGEHKLYLSEKVGSLDRGFTFGSSRENIAVVAFPNSILHFTQ